MKVKNNHIYKLTVSPGSYKLPPIHINNNFRDKKMLKPGLKAHGVTSPCPVNCPRLY
jgi:hypothetical protein